MTVDSIPLAPPRLGEPWTVDDLDRLPPDTAMKYEIIDGSLVVSPLAGAYHGGIASEIWFVLSGRGEVATSRVPGIAQAPDPELLKRWTAEHAAFRPASTR